MMKRGFTLVEVIVARMLTGVVALLAYGSMQAGFDSSDRISTYRSRAEAEALMRSILIDALRHPAEAPSGGPQSLQVSTVTVDGTTSNVLSFVTRGVIAPLGASSPWIMTVGPSPSGLSLSAKSLEDPSQPAINAVLGSVRRLRVRVLRSTEGAVWEGGWSSQREIPAAIEIAFVDSAGRESAPALLVRMTGEYR